MRSRNIEEQEAEPPRCSNWAARGAVKSSAPIPRLRTDAAAAYPHVTSDELPCPAAGAPSTERRCRWYDGRRSPGGHVSRTWSSLEPHEPGACVVTAFCVVLRTRRKHDVGNLPKVPGPAGGGVGLPPAGPALGFMLVTPEL